MTQEEVTEAVIKAILRIGSGVRQTWVCVLVEYLAFFGREVVVECDLAAIVLVHPKRGVEIATHR